MRRTRLAALAAAALLTLPVAATTGATVANADDRSGNNKNNNNKTRVFRAHLEPLNNSGASGVAKLRLKGRTLDIRIDAKGLAPNLVHAQHIHGVGNSECPPMSAAGADGVLSTVDGLPFYGPVVTSLTTSGPTSAAEALTISLMPVADANGEIRYRRTLTLPANVAANLGAFQIVQHGIDPNKNGMYDFSLGKSSLNPEFPLEATAPANCGTIDANGRGHAGKAHRH